MKKHLLTISLIIVLGFLVYANSLNNDFQFDDYRLMDSIKLTRKAEDVLSWHFTSRTISNFTFFLNYHLHGLRVLGYHLVNLSVHILTAILIYWIVFLLLKSDYNDKKPDFSDKPTSHLPPPTLHVPLFTALLFLVHPLCSEPVNYIIARSSLLATMFSFLSLLFFLLFSKYRVNKRKYLYLLGTIFFFLLAGYSKEIGFYYALVMILLYLAVRTDFLEKIRKKGLLLFGISLVGIFLFYLAGGFQRLETGELQFGKYFLTENRVFLDYLKLMIYPLYGLNIDHHHLWTKSIFEFSTLLAIILNLSLLGLAFYLWGKRDSPFKQVICFSIFWLYFLLLPYFFFVSQELMVEYRTYPAIFGFLLLSVSSLEKFVQHRKLKLFIFTGIIFIFSVATFLRNYDWANPLTLWTDAAKKSSNKARVLTNLGNVYSLIGNYDTAIEKYYQSLRMAPLAPQTYLNLGSAYHAKGELDLAIETYKKTLELDLEEVQKAKIYSHLGDAYFDKGMLEEAREAYDNALKLRPSEYEVYWRRGILDYRKGQLDSAIEEFKKAITVYPDYPVGYNSLGIVYDLKGQYDSAIKSYQKAIALMPGYAEAYYNLGISYENLNQLDEAISSYNQAIKYNPDYAKAYNNLGNVYYKKGNFEKGIEYFKKAVSYAPQLVEAYNNLGTVYLEKKMYTQAAEMFKKVLEINPQDKEAKKNYHTALSAQSE